MNFDQIFQQNFLEYASYVIKDRAIPTLEDGLKPVQRRILHSLFEMHDGSFHKVANIVGHCMKYHPHGDMSIYCALVNLANKDLLIEKQGNFGNILTGDGASAARYIECRLEPLAHRLLYNPSITNYESSYDGRNKEPVLFRSKIPLVLIQGAEGIAVGMSTKILPHNFGEVIKAMQACLKGENFEIYPDFPTGGFLDVSGYEEGNGKIISRARVDSSDPKRLVIQELPFGVTTESLLNSIDLAVKKGKLKLLSVQDYSAERVEIELKLPRAVHSQEVLPSLYAYTEAQVSLSLNLLVVSQGVPRLMKVSQVIEEYCDFLKDILKDELELTQARLKKELALKTLEQIFIEERLYKTLEGVKKEKNLREVLSQALEPFYPHLLERPENEDLNRLLNMPIRRISAYDREKSDKELKTLKSDLRIVKHKLIHLVDYALEYLEDLLKDYPHLCVRRTEIKTVGMISHKEIAQKDKPLYYNKQTGYLGSEVVGELVDKYREFDRILTIDKQLKYSLIKLPTKLFVGELLFVGSGEKEDNEKRVFSLIYKENSYHYLKRFKLVKFIAGKVYEDLLPKGATFVSLAINAKGLDVKLSQGLKGIAELSFDNLEVFLIKTKTAGGKRLTSKPVQKIKWQMD